MKHVTATVLTLCLLATGTAVAAPQHERGPQHGSGQSQRHAQPARPHVAHQPPKALPAPRHAPPPRMIVQHGPRYGAPPRLAQPGPRHAPPPRHVGYTPRRGDRLPPTMRGHRVSDWRHAGLRQPPRGHEWRRVDNRTLLVAVASGVIAEVMLRGY